MNKVLSLASLALAVVLFGCEKAQEKPASKEEAKSVAPKKVERDLESLGIATDDKSAAQDASSGHGGDVIALGTSKLGAFEVRASRDKVEFKAGGEAPIDVWIDGGVGKNVTAVRFWIGAQDAQGSIKAKADIEDGKWHTHVEIPAPIPAGSMLWVEIEHADSQKILGSFDLKK
ncbi:MAG: hypothetical protein AABZ47_09900 [Planctomycetota bacterium]